MSSRFDFYRVILPANYDALILCLERLFSRLRQHENRSEWHAINENFGTVPDYFLAVFGRALLNLPNTLRVNFSRDGIIRARI